jgi:hypothetical protein
MTPENFVYWLQGCLELNGNTTLNKKQVQMIRDHLALVLTKKAEDVWQFTPTPYVCSG